MRSGRTIAKILVWVVGLMIGLYGLAWIAIPIVIEPDPVETRVPPEQELELLIDAVGWYEIELGTCALLTYAADGGLALVSAEGELFFQRFELVEADRFVWRRSEKEPVRDVRLERSDAGAVVAFEWTAEGSAPRQAPRCVAPYEPRAVSYTNAEVELSGTLFVPTAIMIHGSGTSDRDNLWYLQIAHHLAKHEMAVLLPDKRGCGLSGGEWREAGFEDFAADTEAGIELVRDQPEVDPARVGLVGISQGGSWIAPMVAADRSDLPFVVSLSGAGVTANQQLAHESLQTLRQMGFPEPVAVLLQPIASAVPKARRPVWWKKNGEVDPLPYWERVQSPVLILYGREDERDNVPVQTSVARLASLRASRGSDFRIEVFEGVGHGFREPGSSRIRPDVLQLLGDWIREHDQRR
jgi:dipeptidyl aminopeptidase/acylaminoacyl peptidase